jgi:hypothetical protein
VATGAYRMASRDAADLGIEQDADRCQHRLGAVTVKAYELIRNGGFGPGDLKFLNAVFDAAWQEIASRFSTDDEREAARLKLAGIILTLGKYHHDYVTAELQARAIEVFDMWPLIALPP